MEQLPVNPLTLTRAQVREQMALDAPFEYSIH